MPLESFTVTDLKKAVALSMFLREDSWSKKDKKYLKTLEGAVNIALHDTGLPPELSDLLTGAIVHEWNVMEEWSK